MIKLDEYEQDILESYEKGEWVSTAQTKADLSRFKASANATLIKNRQINIPENKTPNE